MPLTSRRPIWGRRKCFVIPTKSFVKIGITKIFCYNNKMFSSINNTFGCCSKFLVEGIKNSYVVPYFVTVTQPFFFRESKCTAEASRWAGDSVTSISLHPGWSDHPISRDLPTLKRLIRID